MFKQTHLTFNSQMREIFSGVSPSKFVLAYSTAASYLGLINSNLYFTVEVFTESLIPEIKDNPDIIQHIISFTDIDYSMNNGVNCTTINQTIIDLIRQDEDSQAIQEILADYWIENEKSFRSLDIPKDISEKFQKYSNWAMDYYSE